MEEHTQFIRFYQDFKQRYIPLFISWRIFLWTKVNSPMSRLEGTWFDRLTWHYPYNLHWDCHRLALYLHWMRLVVWYQRLHICIICITASPCHGFALDWKGLCPISFPHLWWTAFHLNKVKRGKFWLATWWACTREWWEQVLLLPVEGDATLLRGLERLAVCSDPQSIQSQFCFHRGKQFLSPQNPLVLWSVFSVLVGSAMLCPWLCEEFGDFPEIQGPKCWEFGCAFAAADLGGGFVKGGGPAYGSALCGLCRHRSPGQRPDGTDGMFTRSKVGRLKSLSLAEPNILCPNLLIKEMIWCLSPAKLPRWALQVQIPLHLKLFCQPWRHLWSPDVVLPWSCTAWHWACWWCYGLLVG